MPDASHDTGPTTSQLWGSAWILVLCAAVAWAFLAVELGRRRPWDTATGFALAVAVTSTVFAAACTVLVGVKSAEVRLRALDDVRRP